MNKLNFFLKHKGKIILIIIIAIAIVGGRYYYKKYSAKKNRGQEYMTEQIKRGEIKVEINKDGSLFAKESIEVNSRASGRIKEIYVKEGDIVKEGQKLLVVQPGQSVHEKFLPIEVLAPSSGMLLRCLNDRWSRQSGTTYDLPQPGDSVEGTGGYGRASCIMKIVKPGKYVVPVKIGEFDISKVKIGQAVKINLLAREGVSYEGVISIISPQPEIKDEDYWNPDSNKVEYITVAETTGNIKEILIGMTASVQIPLETKGDILIIPSSVIFEEKDRKENKLNFFVYKKTGDKAAKKIKVELGLRGDNEAELLNAETVGLAEGDDLMLAIDYEGLKIDEQ